MRLAFVLGVALGFAAILAGAHYYRWVDLPALDADVSVLPDGGLDEQFVIRLPADRMASFASPDMSLRARPFPADLQQPTLAQGEPILVAQYKLRDKAGDIVGIAAHHWTQTAKGPASAWLLLLPGRGALLLHAPGQAAGALATALAAAGHESGQPWVGEVQVEAAKGEAAGAVGASGQFRGFVGHYSEAWELTGVDSDGALRGTVTLETTLYDKEVQ